MTVQRGALRTDLRGRLLAALERGEVDRVPAASPVQTATKELMDASGVSFPQAHRDPAAMAALARAAHTLAGLEGVRVPFSADVDRAAFLDAAGGRPLEGVDRYEVPHPRSHGPAPVVLRAVALLRERCGEVPVLAGCGAPFTLAAALMGEENAIMAVLTDPARLTVALDAAREWCVRYADELIAAGADVLVPLDPTATGEILGPEQFERFALPGERSLARRIGEGGGKSIMHICGDTSLNLALMGRSGMDGLNLDQVMDLRRAREVLGPGIAIVGNVSPLGVLRSGRPEEVRAEAERCLADGADVLSPGCAFSPETPIANMRALAEAPLRSRE